jgi:hypothetical protein
MGAVTVPTTKRRRARFRAATILLVVLAVAAAACSGSDGRATSPTHASHRPTTAPPASAAATAATSLGPDGVVANWVVAENAKPGTTAWQITSSGGPAFIEGFADHVDAQAGDSVGLYVSTNAPTFQVVAYRMGYYGGTGARQVWASQPLSGSVQAGCPLTAGVNLVSCDNWSRSTTLSISSAFVPGNYLLKLVGSTGPQSYVPLTVDDPMSHAAYLIMGRALTEEGWNAYGGYDFYEGRGGCPPGASSYPVCNRARIVSFDRPFADGDGSSDFLSNEYPLVRFSEQHGLDVTYASDVAIDAHPDWLMQHKALLSLGHDETWTYAERQGAAQAVAHGMNIVFFGAAAVLRHARLQASSLGPDRQEVNYRDSSADPLNGKTDPMQVTGNTWSAPPSNWPENNFVGEQYAGYLRPGTGTVPLVVFDPSAWIFAGTGLQAGATVPGVIDSDFDHLDPVSAPAQLQVFAHSPIPLTVAYTNQGKWGADTYADTTYYTDPTSNAGIFDSGTVNWIDALSPCAAGTPCPADALSIMTGNLLKVFGQGPAGTIVGSTGNWHTVSPAGS